MSGIKVLIPMSDYGHDPTETAIPYTTFTNAGFTVHFATENGTIPACDRKMLEGITQKLLGATQEAVTAYKHMTQTKEFTSPLSWSSDSFSLNSYDVVFLPGGHEKSVRQLIDSEIMHQHLISYWKGVEKPGKKHIGAVCHGVMVLSETLTAGKSIIHDCDTTALPGMFEGAAYWSTRWALGDYYKTYGAGSENVETSVRKRLDDPEKQWKHYIGLQPFVVEDEKYNYISGRWPGDAQLLADRIVELVKKNTDN
ncbi:uncharacterized protein EAE97_009779 [Botrytis byssoidea]|uniref:DJ-1/PfpI domain-containing protein n=1 Tax=Botrytis byssoidea TaxID=139641 RepID=A0A9P5I912_9HELO|nr:uncharacterized protein EAE97_009779 [Botrytis byssoidea]KAF7928937.1 hypothetical protein EAE97_009779 [Botrytis byssoidea]